MRRLVVGGLVALFVLGTTVPAGHAAVQVNLGIYLNAPPPLVVVPGTPVTYAPSVPGNYFFYGGRYYVFASDVWYVSRGYNGPWVAVAPAYVPPPLLAVPIRYYHARPVAWRHWRHDAPPHWASHWGRRWERGGPPAYDRPPEWGPPGDRHRDWPRG